MTQTKAELAAMAAELAATEVLVETNEGTYGSGEAVRAIGSGDPAHANYSVYQCVGTGKRRHVGCDSTRAPGYARHFAGTLAEKQRELKRLREQIANAR